MAFTVTSSSSTVAVLLIYRPGFQQVTNQFFVELTSYLETMALYKCQIIVAGDFNIHVENKDDNNASRLLDLLANFNCVQHVVGPTHTCGGTLDHIYTREDQIVTELRVDPAGIISDHGFITWKINFTSHPPIASRKTIHSWKRVNRTDFRQALKDSPLCANIPDQASSEESFTLYETVLQELADRFAPERTVTIRRQPIAVWYDDESRDLRRRSRVFEKRYRRSELAEDQIAWVRHEQERHRTNRTKEENYWQMCVSVNTGQPRKLWKVFSSMMGRTREESAASGKPSAQSLLDYFIKKIHDIRQSTGSSPASTNLPPSPNMLHSFCLYSSNEIRKLIVASKTKSCALDPIPTGVLKEFLDKLLPIITHMCNQSLLEGRLPLSQRHAIITPIVKKPGLDCEDIKNYRPISNLTYMSKFVERLVCKQVTSFLEENSLLPRHQSGFCTRHSTETAVLKVMSDILLLLTMEE